MSQSEKVVKKLRCPVCLLNSKDPPLAYDERKDEYYCQVCCYSGREDEVRGYYDVFRQKYRQVNAPLNLKKI